MCKKKTLAGGRALRAIESCINLQRRLTRWLARRPFGASSHDRCDLKCEKTRARAEQGVVAKRRTQAGCSPAAAVQKSRLQLYFAKGGSEPGKSEAGAFCVIRMRRSEHKNGDTITVIE
jgi:hypothetical protein